MGQPIKIASATEVDWDIMRVAYAGCEYVADDQVDVDIEAYENDGWEYIGQDRRGDDCFIAFKRKPKPGKKRARKYGAKNVKTGVGKKGSRQRKTEDVETKDWRDWWED